MSQLIQSADEIDFTVGDLPEMPLPGRVLMVEPTYYSVDYVINPHMADHVGTVDPMLARNQWETLAKTFRNIGLEVNTLPGREGLPDMVFCANQSLPSVDSQDTGRVIMSLMHAEERREEVPYIEQWFRQQGYEITYLDPDRITNFEGCGDAIWHTGRRLLWGGYGYRSSPEAYRAISEHLDLPIIGLELVDEAFYHLDTCLCVLDETTVLIYPGAFTDRGLQLIHALFERVIRATEREAKELFACNATCPNGKHVVIQRGCTDTVKKLQDAEFEVREVDTSEYLKSGGSVFCMKQMVW